MASLSEISNSINKIGEMNQVRVGSTGTGYASSNPPREIQNGAPSNLKINSGGKVISQPINYGSTNSNKQKQTGNGNKNMNNGSGNSSVSRPSNNGTNSFGKSGNNSATNVGNKKKK